MFSVYRKIINFPALYFYLVGVLIFHFFNTTPLGNPFFYLKLFVFIFFYYLFCHIVYKFFLYEIALMNDSHPVEIQQIGNLFRITSSVFILLPGLKILTSPALLSFGSVLKVLIFLAMLGWMIYAVLRKLNFRWGLPTNLLILKMIKNFALLLFIPLTPLVFLLILI